MKKIILSSITAVSLIISSSVAKDIYATIDGVNITKADINIAIQDPRVDFDTLPEKAQKNVLDQIINKKLLAKHAFNNEIENPPLSCVVINSFTRGLNILILYLEHYDCMGTSQIY